MLEKFAETRPDGQSPLFPVLIRPVTCIVVIDFVRLSVDLAHEYVKLGKTKKGAAIYKHTLGVVKSLSWSEETRVLYLLRYSESLASTGDVLKRSVLVRLVGLYVAERFGKLFHILRCVRDVRRFTRRREGYEHSATCVHAYRVT